MKLVEPMGTTCKFVRESSNVIALFSSGARPMASMTGRFALPMYTFRLSVFAASKNTFSLPMVYDPKRNNLRADKLSSCTRASLTALSTVSCDGKSSCSSEQYVVSNMRIGDTFLVGDAIR